MVLEYWLEARDACDFPKANVANSERFQVTLEAAGDAGEQEKKREQERKKKGGVHGCLPRLPLLLAGTFDGIAI